MNEEQQKSIISRVKKMLALAADAGATEGERDNAIRMAHATLAKYNLDMAEVEASTGTIEEERVKETFQFYGRPWARMVSHAVADLFFCKYLYMANSDAKKIGHIFIGRKSNVVTAQELAKWLVESIAREGARSARANYGGNTWKRSFCLGAGHRIWERVREIQDATKNQQATPGKGIVLASLYQREAAANQALIPAKLGKGRSGSRIGFAGAAEQGRAYGSTVQLTTQLGGGSTRPRITRS